MVFTNQIMEHIYALAAMNAYCVLLMWLWGYIRKHCSKSVMLDVHRNLNRDPFLDTALPCVGNPTDSMQCSAININKCL